MTKPVPRNPGAGTNSLQTAVAAARWTGIEPTDRQQSLLETYKNWLIDEAIPAGGLGPNEGDRVWSRHLADSLLFGYGLGEQPACLDAGSGVGLPGIPLAIIHPQIEFELVDKSGRRCDLLKRAIGVLGLENCSVIHSELSSIGRRYPFLVSRAAIPANQMMIHVKQLLAGGGIANISVSRVGEGDPSIDVPVGLLANLVSVPDKILDTRVQLLRIEAIQDGS